MTPEQIILIVIWALLAFIIQPYYITIRISAKYKDKEWVKLNLALSHEALVSRVRSVIVPLIARETTEAVSKSLQTAKINMFHPAMAAAGKLSGEIEGYAEEEIQQQIGLPPAVVEEAAQKIIKKYPSLAIMIPFMQKQAGGGAGGRSGNNGGGDF